MSVSEERLTPNDAEEAPASESKRPTLRVSSKWMAVRAATTVADVIKQSVTNGTISSDGDLSVTFFTDLGIVTGDVMPPDEYDPKAMVKQSGETSISISVPGVFMKSREFLFDKAENEGAEVVPDGSFIVLKNATIRPFDGLGRRYDDKVTLEVLVLFAESIKAFTWGRLQSPS